MLPAALFALLPSCVTRAESSNGATKSYSASDNSELRSHLFDDELRLLQFPSCGHATRTRMQGVRRADQVIPLLLLREFTGFHSSGSPTNNHATPMCRPRT